MTFLNGRPTFSKEDSDTRNSGFQKPNDIFVRRLKIGLSYSSKKA